MKISIEGFDQSRAVELGLCVADVVLLRWFVGKIFSCEGDS